MINEYIQVMTTVEKREDADRMASIVVNKRVAACAQVLGPIRSTYWWKVQGGLAARQGVFPDRMGHGHA